MDSQKLKSHFDMVESYVGRDIGSLLKSGVATKMNVTRIVREDFSILEIEDMQSKLSGHIASYNTQNNSDMIADLEEENFKHQAQQLNNLVDILSSIIDDAEFCIENLPKLLEELFDKQIDNISTTYRKLYMTKDLPNLQAKFNEKKPTKETQGAFFNEYLKEFFRNVLKVKIQAQYFKKNKIQVLDNFQEKYEEILLVEN